jgi:outer membrane protein assembly factor BamD (BamD/ComL family)
MSSTKLLLQLGDTARAEQFLLEFQKEFPSNKYTADSLLLLGQLQYMRQDRDACRATFVQVIDKFSTAPAAITAAFNIAELDRQSGKVEKAIATWQALAEAHPDNDKALAALFTAAMTAYTDLNDPERSRKLFEDYLATGPQDFDLVKKARANLDRLSRGQPPLAEDAKG